MNKLMHTKYNKEKKRNPNIDLIRIAGMLAIIIVHMFQHGDIFNKYKKFIGLQLINIFCKWHVSSFGMISGIVGNLNHKYSNLFYLWFVAVFYLFIIYMIFIKSDHSKIKETLSKYIFPVTYGHYWYFTAYFGIYSFMPFINASITILPKITVKKSIYFMIGMFIIWTSLFGDIFAQHTGYTPITLFIYYIFGAYIGKYIFFKNFEIIFRFLICTICLIIYIFISVISYNIGIKNSYPNINTKFKRLFETYINCLPTLIQVFSIMIFIAQLKFNKYISRIISFIGPLTFDIYLIHENPYIRKHYVGKYVSRQSNELNFSAVNFFVFKGCIYIFIICITIAYLRSIIFKVMKIKNICILIESIMTKIVCYLI